MRELRLPQDSAGFVRRQCPRCGRAFKTRPFSADGLALQRFLTKAVQHQNAHELERRFAPIRCLYCGKPAAPEACLTAEHRRHLERVAAGYAQEVRYEQLRHIERTLADNPRPTFVVLPPERVSATLPPEPDDLQLVPLLCCGEEAKSLPDWRQAVFCPRCGARQHAQHTPRRPGGRAD